MADSAAIDRAIISILASDAALLAAMPNGVFRDEAPPWATGFVILKKEDADDVGEFNRTAYLDRLYRVEPRARVGAGHDVDAAALRVYELLHDQPLTVAGFTYMAMYREGEVEGEKTERDPVDESVQWNKNGAYYRVQMSF